MKYLLTLLTLLILLPLLLAPVWAYGTKDQVTFTVEEKERVYDGESSQYLIFTDGEVLANRDSLYYWKWDSSDVYSDLKEGETFEATVYGLRVPFFSMYRNIVEVKLLTN